MSTTLSRRHFLTTSGALVIAFALAPELAAGQGQTSPLPGSLNRSRRLNAWLRIEPHGVTIFTAKIELGQGIGTALSQIAADELDIDWQRIKVVSGDTALTPNEGQTAGSLSVEHSGTALRFACAEARALLLNAAAAKLGVPVSDIIVRDGTCLAAGGKATTYWELAAEVDLQREATAAVQPKPASALRWVGTSVPRRDIPKKMTGATAYVQDIRLPGVIAVVRDGNFLGVAAQREEQVIKARETLQHAAQ